MTNGEIQTIRNIIARLKEPHIGAASANSLSPLYVETWLIAPLVHLLPETRNVPLAESLSRK